MSVFACSKTAPKFRPKNASRSTNAAQRCIKNDAKSFAFSTFRRTRLARRTLPGNATRSTNAAQRCIKNDANPVRGTLPQCDIVVQISFEIVISVCSKTASNFHKKTPPGLPMPRKGASKVTPKTKKVAKTSHQNRLHRVPGSSSNPKSGTSSHPKCVSPYPTQSVRATRSASPLPLPVAQRGLVIIPRTKDEKPPLSTRSRSAPNTCPCAPAPFRPPNHRKNPPVGFRGHALEIKVPHDLA